MSGRILLRGGHVLSMDPAIGEIPSGDVLDRGELIAGVAAQLDVQDAEILDVGGHVVMPGFIDTHRHTWQTPFRGICADWTLEDYFRGIRMSISPNCSPADVYAGNLAGALEALDAGVTSILDFSHCNNTPEHADAAIQGLRDAGIRAVFAYGYYPAPMAEPVFTDHAMRLADARRIREELLPSDEGLVTMALALTEVGLVPFEDTIAEAASARELGVPSVLHTGCNWGSPITEGIPELDHHGLLSAGQVHVHCNTLDERTFRRLAENDCKVSSSPETEMQMGMGHPVIGRALELGMRPSLSCDVMSSNSGDMFSQMRLGLQFERCMRNDAFNSRNQMPGSLDLTVRDALGWGTANGAHAIGREHQLGSLTPGKQADVVVIGGPAAQHDADGRSGRLHRLAGEPLERHSCPRRRPRGQARRPARRRRPRPGRRARRARAASGCWARSGPAVSRCSPTRPRASRTSSTRSPRRTSRAPGLSTQPRA